MESKTERNCRVQKLYDELMAEGKHGHNVQVGDKVCFEMASAGYVVTGVEQTEIGMVRHQHDGGSNSYWPNELLYVQVEDPITAYYTDF